MSSTESMVPVIVRGDYVWTGQTLIKDGAVVSMGDTITAVGPWTEVGADRQGARVIGGSGRIVLPGLINAHHHGNGVTSFARGVLDDNLEPWLASMGSSPYVDPYFDTLLAALDTIAGGYTTMVLFQSTGHPEGALEEAVARIEGARAVGLRIAFGLDVTQRNFYVYGPDPAGWPPRQGLSTSDYIALLDELRIRYEGDPLVEIFAAPSGPEWVTDATWTAAGEWSRQHGLPLHTHALESPLQAEYARRQYEDGLVAHLDGLGALHEYTSLVHGVYLDGDDFGRMAERGAHLITNPGSNLRLRCGVSPVLLALERGVNVALGTDGCSLGDRDDAMAELRLLLHLQRGTGIDTPALTWDAALSMATDAAARVTPWAGDQGIGTLVVGARADFSVYDLEAAGGPWWHPDLHPVHVLLHRAGRQHLDSVVIGGQLVWDGKTGSQRVDEKAVARETAQSIGGNPSKGTSPKASLADTVTNYYREWLKSSS